MINIKNNYYKLWFLDTNIISEMIKNKKTIFKNSISEFNLRKIILCFSIYTLFELYKKEKLFEEFITYFCKLPFFLIKNYNQLLTDEISSYPKINDYSDFGNKHIDIFNFSHFAFSDNPEELFKEYLKKSNFNHHFNVYEKEKLEIFRSILDLKNNYCNENYSEFVEKVVLQQLIINDKNFLKNIIYKKDLLTIDNFKSLKMMAFIVFYKFYNTDRKPEFSDISDIAMSSVYPYMDAVITECNQADYLNKIKKNDKFIGNLDIISLKGFRSFAGSDMLSKPDI